MDWIHDAAHQLGVKLDQQKPQFELDSFDFVRTQRFGICRLPRPRVALAMTSTDSAGWSAVHREELCQTLCSTMQAALVVVGKSEGPAIPSAKDLRGKLLAREIAAVLKQCDLMISEDEEMVSLASAVGIPAVYICRKSWDSWTAAEGDCVVPVYPEKPGDVMSAVKRLLPIVPVG